MLGRVDGKGQGILAPNKKGGSPKAFEDCKNIYGRGYKQERQRGKEGNSRRSEMRWNPSSGL